MIEKLTISRLGQVKTVNFTTKDGKPKSFNKIGFQTVEYGDRWYDFILEPNAPSLESGKQYEFDVKSREYNGKTYYDARLPRQNDILREEVEQLKRRVSALEQKTSY